MFNLNEREQMQIALIRAKLLSNYDLSELLFIFSGFYLRNAFYEHYIAILYFNFI